MFFTFYNHFHFKRMTVLSAATPSLPVSCSSLCLLHSHTMRAEQKAAQTVFTFYDVQNKDEKFVKQESNFSFFRLVQAIYLCQ